MPEDHRAGGAIRDLLLVIAVAVAGLVLGALAAGIPASPEVFAPPDLAPSRSIEVAAGTSPHSSGGVVGGEQDEPSAKPPVRHQPPVFPFSGQPGSVNRVDLRQELAQMAQSRRHTSPAAATPSAQEFEARSTTSIDGPP